MKQLSSFMVMDVDGGTRISYTYDEIDPDNGSIIRHNVKENFFAIDESFKADIRKVQDYIRNKRLS